MKKITTKSIELGGRTLSLEVGRVAGQADAAVLARYGETVVLATVVSSKPRADLDYFPLSVEYVERLYAGGRIKGSRFVKREGRPSDEAILYGRVVDRSIRPLFPKGYFNEVQVILTVLSVDLENNPEVLAVTAASAALAISSVPWEGPIAAVKVGYTDGTYVVNPVNGDLASSDLDLTVTATEKTCLMLEAQAKQASEETILGAIAFGQEEAKKIIELVSDLAKEVGKTKQKFEEKRVKSELKNTVLKLVGSDLDRLVEQLSSKEMASSELDEIKVAIAEKLTSEEKEQLNFVFEEVFRDEIRKNILAGKRPDGRKIDEIRPIDAEVGVLPRTHGSAIFTRGQTQVLTVTTLGSPAMEQLIEGPEGEETKRFIHHYSMPPYSTGETGRVGTPSRREIGHGALAEKALMPVVPSEDSFPYTIRLVSEVMSSNGSTSMASTCGSTLSLMDAGVPIAAPVAGLALGLVQEGEKASVLSDIVGLEDHYGDMDFKVAGTKTGITAIQLDVKNKGLSPDLLKEVLARAKEGREFILGKMLAVLGESREGISQYAPKVTIIHVPADKIGEVIGPGGRMIRKIIEETKANVDIEDDGTVNITGPDQESVAKAVTTIENLTKEVKPGEIYEGEVKRIQPFGAFVEILPGKEGLVHVSQMAEGYVSNPSEVVSLGQKVQVRVTEIDEQHRINLSMILDPSIVKERSPGGPGGRPERSGGGNRRPGTKFGDEFSRYHASFPKRRPSRDRF